MTIETFIPDFNNFLITKQRTYHMNATEYVFQNDDEFRSDITEFLYTSERQTEWRKSFIFPDNLSLTCGKNSPPIRILKFDIRNFR